ncbi:MAG: hypothetical protein R3F14_03355 [Polyangiaceae bacterium]
MRYQTHSAEPTSTGGRNSHSEFARGVVDEMRTASRPSSLRIHVTDSEPASIWSITAPGGSWMSWSASSADTAIAGVPSSTCTAPNTWRFDSHTVQIEPSISTRPIDSAKLQRMNDPSATSSGRAVMGFATCSRKRDRLS